MMFRSLLLSVCLSAPLLAQDAAKTSASSSGSQDKPSASAEWSWPLPSADTLIRFFNLSAAGKARLQAEFATNSDALQSLSVKEYNARFEKAFRAAVQDDEAKGLSSGGIPAEIFKEHGLTPDSFPRSSTPEPAKDQRRGITPEMRQRWEKLSDNAKEKLKTFFRENRERLSSMSEEQRRTLIDSNFKTIEQADAASRNGQ